MIKIILSSLLFILSIQVHAFLVPDGADYKVMELKKFKVIYTEESKKYLERLIIMENKIISDYDKTFQWTLDDKLTVVLASDGNQIANAFATPFSRNINTFYNGGGALVDYFSMKSWLFSLVSHEGAHAYQLDTKTSLSKIYYNVFGSNPMPHIFFVLPVFTNPNFLLPTWLIEGNAVFNESRFGNGGRLFSGEMRALYCSLVKSGKLNEKRLTNNHLDFPYTQEKYIVGGYFFNFLYEKYGLIAVNTFYKEQSNHWIWPFRLSVTFEDHFGMSYGNLLNEFIYNYSSFCKKQKKVIGKAFAKSIARVPFGDDDKEVWAVATNGKKTPELFIINRKSGKLKRQNIDLGLNRVFKIDDKHFASNDSGKVSLTELKYSLWDKNGDEIEKYRGKIITDKIGEDILWISPKESFDEQYLYHNKKRIGVTHSSAKFDKNKNIYRFIQRGNERILYKNQTALFSFKSFYSKLVDVDGKGRVYFIASTKTGSTLYYYEKGKVYKETRSDSIVDARELNGNFLISEITSTGYEFKVAKLGFKEQLPTFYDYKFAKKLDFDLYNDIPTVNATYSLVEMPEHDDYSMFKNIEFRGGWSQVNLAGNRPIANLNFRIADPLDFNEISLTGGTNKYSGSDYIYSTYILKKYLWDYYLAHQFKMRYPTKDNPKRLKETENKLSFGTNIPLYQTRYQSLGLTFAIGKEFEDDKETGYGALIYNYTRSYRLAYFPYRKFDFLIEYESESDNTYEASAYLGWTIDLGSETSFKIDNLIRMTNEFELTMAEIQSGRVNPILSTGYSLFSSYDQKRSMRTGIELKKAINYGVYFSSFPISLRRFAPQIIFNRYEYDARFKGSFNEYGAGVNFEFLLGHLAPFDISVNYMTREFEDESFVVGMMSVF